MARTIAANMTANGSSSPPLVYTGSAAFGTFVNLQVFGIFNGATVTIEARIDGTNWTPLDGGVFTTPKLTTLRLRSADLRATLSNAGASTDVTIITT